MPPTPAQLDHATATTPIISLEGVSKSFGDVRALQEVTIHIPPGKTTVILGPSGCGKSVMLKHIIGLLKPDAGSVTFDGQRVDRLREHEMNDIRTKVGFLFQQGALFDSMTVGQNIGFPLREHSDLSFQERAQRVDRMLEIVGVPGTADRMPAELSGGQQKRVALARAVILEPSVVLYDEPTTGLDPIRSDIIARLIQRLQARLSLTSVVVTHDITTAFKIADTMVMMQNGHVLLSGPPSKFKSSDDEVVRRFLDGDAGPSAFDLPDPTDDSLAEDNHS
jgi:phospholipid/cholesterol/gamma-HCH transport system ATP-binding protein